MSGAFDIQEPQQQSGVFPTSQEPSPPPAGDNEGKEREFVNNVRRLGRDSAAGKEALPSLVVAIVDAINTGALNPSKKFRMLDGTEADASHFILEQYSNEEGRKLSHERTPLGKRTAASKIKQIIKAARMVAPQGSPDYNFRGAIDRAMEARPELAKGGKLKPAFDCYVSMARAQLKSKSPITDEVIAKSAVRTAGYQNDFVKELKRMHSRLVKLLGDDPKVTVHIDPGEEIYSSMEEVATALEEAIRVYEEDYNKPKGENSGYSAQLAKNNAEVDEQIRGQAAQ